MKLLVLQHVPFEGPAAIKAWADKHGHPISHHCCANSTTYPDPSDFDACIIMGGPMGVNDAPDWMAAEISFIQDWLASGKFLLGICLGAQLIATALGASVAEHHCQEIGWFDVEKVPTREPSNWIDAALPERFEALHWHGDSFDTPTNARHLYRSASCENQAFIYRENVVGLQFHLEFDEKTAERVADACASELMDTAATVQSRASLLAQPERFDNANALMHRLLDAMRQAFMLHNM